MPQRITAPGLPGSALFAHAVATEPGRLLLSSGFLSRDPASGKIGPAGDAAEQTRRVLSSIEQVLNAAGASMKDLVRMTVYLVRREDYAAMNSVRREVLAGLTYASTTVLAGLLDPDALIEIDVVAQLPADAAGTAP